MSTPYSINDSDLLWTQLDFNNLDRDLIRKYRSMVCPVEGDDDVDDDLDFDDDDSDESDDSDDQDE